MDAVIAIWGITALGSALLAALIAPYRNRCWNRWATWTFLFPPALLLLVLLPRATGPRRGPPTLDQLDRTDDRML